MSELTCILDMLELECHKVIPHCILGSEPLKDRYLLLPVIYIPKYYFTNNDIH